MNASDTGSLGTFLQLRLLLVLNDRGEPRPIPEDGREEISRLFTSLRDLIGKHDFYAGGLMLLLGLSIAPKGSTYRAGTLMHMGRAFCVPLLASS